MRDGSPEVAIRLSLNLRSARSLRSEFSAVSVACSLGRRAAPCPWDLSDKMRLARHTGLNATLLNHMVEIDLTAARGCLGANEGPDPAETLSAAALAQTLGVSEEEVRIRESVGEIFSVVRPSRGPQREYPAFQTWPGIQGEPLGLVLAALGRPSGPQAYIFFTSPLDALAGLSPAETLANCAGRLVTCEEARELLGKPQAYRTAAVISAARAYADALKGW